MLFCFSAYTSFGRGMLYAFVYTHVYTLACAFGCQSSKANILLSCAPTNFWRQGISLNLDLTNSARLGRQILLGSVCFCMPSIGITVLQYSALLSSNYCKFTSFTRRQFPNHLIQETRKALPILMEIYQDFSHNLCL